MREDTATDRDDDLLVAVAGGDAAAFRLLYDRHAPWLALRLSKRCADEDIVAQVLQDTFLRVWTHARTYRARGEVGAWIWGIGIRRLLDVYRRRGAAPTPQRARRDSEPSAEDLVLLGVQYGDLAGALDRLSPELLAVVQATIIDGLTTREAARLLGIPTGTVKTRAMRARARLREDLA